MVLPQLATATEEKAGWGRGERNRNESHFRHVEFVPVGHPGGDVQQAGGNTGLSSGEVGAGDIDLGVISI